MASVKKYSRSGNGSQSTRSEQLNRKFCSTAKARDGFTVHIPNSVRPAIWKRSSDIALEEEVRLL